MSRRQELAVALIVAFSAATFVFFTSDHLFSRSTHRADTIGMQFALLRGAPYTLEGGVHYLPANQNRVLFAVLLAGVSRIPALSVFQWFAVLRFATALTLFLATWFITRRVFTAPPEVAAASVLLLAYVLTFTFSPPYAGEYTSDLLDALFAAAFVTFTVERRRAALVAAALLAASNRESAAFAGLIWFCCYGIESRKLHAGETAFAAGVSIAAYAMVMAIRYWLGGFSAVGLDTQLITGPSELWLRTRAFLRSPQLSGWPVLLAAAAAPLALWLRANRDRLTGTHRRLLVAAAVLAIVSLEFGAPDELRIFIPSWVVVVLVAAASAGRSRFLNSSCPSLQP